MHPDDLGLAWDLEYDCVVIDGDGNEHRIKMNEHGVTVEVVPNQVKPLYKKF